MQNYNIKIIISQYIYLFINKCFNFKYLILNFSIIKWQIYKLHIMKLNAKLDYINSILSSNKKYKKPLLQQNWFLL